MSEPFYSEGLRFECTGCSRCCRHQPGYVFLTADDLAALADATERSRDEFLNDYCRRVDMAGFSRISLREKSNFDCIFWEEGGCSVYAARPLQCRTFPFWSSFLGSRDEWESLSADCSGANRGRLYSRAEIERLVALRQENPMLGGDG